MVSFWQDLWKLLVGNTSQKDATAFRQLWSPFKCEWFPILKRHCYLGLGRNKLRSSDRRDGRGLHKQRPHVQRVQRKGQADAAPRPAYSRDPTAQHEPQEVLDKLGLQHATPIHLRRSALKRQGGAQELVRASDQWIGRESPDQWPQAAECERRGPGERTGGQRVSERSKQLQLGQVLHAWRVAHVFQPPLQAAPEHYRSH